MKKTSIKYYLALVALIVISVLMVIKIGKNTKNVSVTPQVCTVEKVDLYQELSYFMSMPAEDSDYTFVSSNKTKV